MDYETFYKLKEHPFSFTTDEKYYYNSPQHSKALIKLVHAVENEKGLAVLIGDIGTGKTTLSRRLLDHLIQNGYEATLLVIIHSEITSLWFLKKLALMFEADSGTDDKIQIITSLYHRLLEIHEKGKTIVVLIDEANMLQRRDIMEEIRGLLNLESEKGKLLNFILFGLTEMEDYLKLDPPLYQRIAVRCILEPLDYDSTLKYITHRLKVAGCDRPLFTSGAIKIIHNNSRGIPRLINAICDNALLEGFLLKKDVIEEKIVTEVSHDLGLIPKES